MADSQGEGVPKSMANIDRLIHEPARLMIVALLYVVESGDFTSLMRKTGLTWGNLWSHMRKLENAGYIEAEKRFKGKKPNTVLRLTGEGRAAFRKYRLWMRRVLDELPD